MIKRFFQHIFYIGLVLSSLLPAKIYSQVCEGNLGENIFSIGDFGSGEDNIVQVNPQIAPGYSYTTITPPSDGFYILTNNMAEWNNLYGTWLPIGDNSPDPNGYMMVVNASYEPGIFYEELVDGLCENTLYEFSADVINLIFPGSVPPHSDPNVSFLLDGEVQYTTGNIPKDLTWHKYGFTFVTGPGQTSVLLTLRNNAPGGIGNDLALDNISFRPCGPDAFANAESEFLLCSNDINPVSITAETNEDASIQWQFYNQVSEEWEDIPGANGEEVFHNIFDPGEYLYRYLSAGSDENLMNSKCRVISDTAKVTVVPIEFEVFDTICENVPYEFGSQTLTEEGFYEETFIASNGCDSFVDLYLSISPYEEIEFDLNILDPSCADFSDAEIEMIYLSGGTEPFTFYLNDSINNLTGQFTDLQPGNYFLEIYDRYRCSVSTTQEIINPELFEIDLGPDSLIELGQVFDFEIESNYPISSAEWSGTDLECINCLFNSVRPLENGRFSVIAISETGCIASDSIFIRLKDLNDQFFRPNVFSPNNDGINDEFKVYTRSLAVDFVERFSIYDRFGNKIYEVANLPLEAPELSWDGRFNGQFASPGVYLYVMNLKLITGQNIQLTGDITIID